MKKTIAILSGVFLTAAFVGCASSGEEKIKFISAYDTYNDCKIAYIPDISHGDAIDGGYGSAVLSINRNAEYIKQGNGSLKIETLTPFLKQKIDAYNYNSQVNQAKNAKKISIDVYNPNSQTIDFAIEVRSTEADMIAGEDGEKTDLLLAVRMECAPNAWTTVSAEFTENVWKNDVEIYRYWLLMENTADEVFSLYLDNFYVEYR